MSISNQIAERIDHIVETFKRGRKAGEDIKDHNILLPVLNSTDKEFRSMAFEGASMGIALRCLGLDEENRLDEWIRFFQNNTVHSTQILIGLGWALGDRDLKPAQFISNLDPISKGRVLDGYGYYFGLFRRRLSIRAQQIPEGIEPEMLKALDQGLGRSLWYISKGETDRLERMVNGFSEQRKPALWRGIGVACTVVGGSSEAELISILKVSDQYYVQLKAGCIMGASSLVKAGVSNSFTERTCKVWLNRTAQSAADITTVAADSYEGWINHLESVC